MTHVCYVCVCDPPGIIMEICGQVIWPLLISIFPKKKLSREHTSSVTASMQLIEMPFRPHIWSQLWNDKQTNNKLMTHKPHNACQFSLSIFAFIVNYCIQSVQNDSYIFAVLLLFRSNGPSLRNVTPTVAWHQQIFGNRPWSNDWCTHLSRTNLFSLSLAQFFLLLLCDDYCNPFFMHASVSLLCLLNNRRKKRKLNI